MNSWWWMKSPGCCEWNVKLASQSLKVGRERHESCCFKHNQSFLLLHLRLCWWTRNKRSMQWSRITQAQIKNTSYKNHLSTSLLCETIHPLHCYNGLSGCISDYQYHKYHNVNYTKNVWWVKVSRSAFCALPLTAWQTSFIPDTKFKVIITLIYRFIMMLLFILHRHK